MKGVTMKKTAIAFTLTLSLLCVSVAQDRPIQPESFDNIGMLVPDGKKTKEENVRLKLESDRIVVEERKGGTVKKEFKYADIKSAEYSYSKHPRWKAGAGVAIAVGIFALPLFFMKGKKHWLTVKTETDYAVLRLDKNNYKVILPSFETKSGKKVETITEDK
jgi:hypothetical protein